MMHRNRPMRGILHSFLTFAGLLLPTLLGAQAGGYRYSRMLSPVDCTDYYKLRINSDILYKARPSGVVRVYELKEKDTVEVPYLLYDRPEDGKHECVKALKLINTSFIKDKASYYTCVIDTPGFYSMLTFNISDEVYDKDLSLEGSDDNLHWKTILEKEKVFRFPMRGSDHECVRNAVYFPEQAYKYLRVTFDDSHSARLSLGSVLIECRKHTEDLYQDEAIPLKLSRREVPGMKATELTCLFPREYFVTALRFRVRHKNPFYKRLIHIYEAQHEAQKPDIFLYADNYLVSDSYNYISLAHGSGSDIPETYKVAISIENEDDQPLDEIEVEAFTNTQTLKLKLEKGKSYMLAYGKKDDHRPVYDMAYFSDHIPAHLHDITLGNEVQLAKPHAVPPPKEPFFKSAAWIWGLMIVSILIIGGFAVSLLRQSKTGKQD